MRTTLKLAAAAALVLVPTAALADYPEKPITVINPNSAGGGTDVGIRTWQPYVEKCLGEGATLVPTAMPGAASGVGIAALHVADPDGYTVGMTNMPNFVTNTLSRADAPPVEDFDFIGNVIGVRSSINVRADSRFETWDQAVEYIKGHDGPINVGMGGVGADECGGDGCMNDGDLVGRFFASASQLWAFAGFSMKWFADNGYGGAAVEMKLTLHEPIRVGQDYAIHSWVPHMSSKMLPLSNQLVSVPDARPLASISANSIVMDHATRMAVDIPEEFRRKHANRFGELKEMAAF